MESNNGGMGYSTIETISSFQLKISLNSLNVDMHSGVRRKNFRGFQGYGRPRRGCGGGAPLTPENFRKFAINFLKKIAKMHYFSIFFKKVNNHALIFRAFERKLQIVWKFWENFGNFWWKFNWKIEFLYIFGKSCW